MTNKNKAKINETKNSEKQPERPQIGHILHTILHRETSYRMMYCIIYRPTRVHCLHLPSLHPLPSLLSSPLFHSREVTSTSPHSQEVWKALKGLGGARHHLVHCSSKFPQLVTNQSVFGNRSHTNPKPLDRSGLTFVPGKVD